MKKILVIEDDANIQEDIQHFLNFEGFCRIMARNGREGLQLAKVELPDLILCDVSMPELNGFEVLTALRQDQKTATIPLIFMTGKADRTNLRLGMELGADDYLTKPFTPVELLRAVATQLQKRSTIAQQSQTKLDSLNNSITLVLPYEFQSPIETIISSSKTLIENNQKSGDMESLNRLKTIQSCGENLHRLTQNLLLYTQLEFILKSSEQRASFRGHQICEDAEATVAEVALQKAEQVDRLADLHLKFQPTRVAIPEADLQKIAEEVIDNAFKFSKPGSSIKIVGTAKNGRYILQIINQGIGMTVEQIGQALTSPQFTNKIYGQPGLRFGLLIAKRLTDLYDGELMLQSTPGKQMIVQISLPIAKPPTN
jgi:two-component system, sensor histidine kinase and response regulator